MILLVAGEDPLMIVNEDANSTSLHADVLKCIIFDMSHVTDMDARYLTHEQLV